MITKLFNGIRNIVSRVLKALLVTVLATFTAVWLILTIPFTLVAIVLGLSIVLADSINSVPFSDRMEKATKVTKTFKIEI